MTNKQQPHRRWLLWLFLVCVVRLGLAPCGRFRSIHASAKPAFVPTPRCFTAAVRVASLFQPTTATKKVAGSSSISIPHSQRQRRQCRLWAGTGPSSSSRTNTTTETRVRRRLPDYGQTSVEIDRIELVAKRWRRRDLFGQSLIEQTKLEMQQQQHTAASNNSTSSSSSTSLSSSSSLTREERTAQRRSLRTAPGIPNFMHHVQQHQQSLLSTSSLEENVDKETAHEGPFQLRRRRPTVLQINIGLYCNQACGHCHVESSPLRTSDEMMTAETAAQCLALLAATPSITTLDITGGAPELNANFRMLVSTARQLRPHDLIIIDRCNLTVLQEPGQEDLIDFLKQHKVQIIASLPCYSEKNVDQQRGNGVFERSIAALLALNDAGYGRSSLLSSAETENGNANQNDGSLKLDLVYNPSGAFLPPPQDKLEVQYKEQLASNFGILFDQLFTITNMPIKRFADFLHRRDELVEYMELLVRNFNPDTVPSLMCRDTVSVGYDGRLYDCDFNQQLDLGMLRVGGKSTPTKTDTSPTASGPDGLTVFDLSHLGELQDNGIRTDLHCFGCTAGMGSS